LTKYIKNVEIILGGGMIKRCPRCKKNDFSQIDHYCDQCGEGLVDYIDPRCEHCGSQIKRGDRFCKDYKFCKYCGKKIRPILPKLRPVP
tara:strand:+ start:503 stop:769 length:267 start_codon:yes stop_codon:yes gene_type:complete